ncbi:MAG: ribonuclease P protein component [Mogibacterium sp.]|nr:ribonuclease P protein component [Mogibacterium sp.]
MLKKNILRNQRDFVTVYNKGKSQGSKYVVVLYRRNRLGENRVAFIASKKVGNSVRRNRARRLMKEAFRALEPSIAQGYDIILVARNGIDATKEQDVERSLRHAFSRATLLN